MNQISMSSQLIEAIVGEQEMIDFVLNPNSRPEELILISIQSPDHKKDISVFQKQFKKSISLKFFDIDEDIGAKSGGFQVKPISNEQAKELSNFIMEHKNERFFIHCFFGQSRSAAIGLAVEFLLLHNGCLKRQSNFVSDIMLNSKYDPNMEVFDRIVNNTDLSLLKDNKFVCNKCEAGFDKPITGLKNGVNVDICPICFESQ